MRKFELTDVFEVTYKSDSDEDWGRQIHLGYFTYEGDAKKAAIAMGDAKKAAIAMGDMGGVMGTNGNVRRVSTSIIVYDTFDEYQTVNRELTRKNALKKLTKAEQQILGLEDGEE